MMLTRFNKWSPRNEIYEFDRRLIVRNDRARHKALQNDLDIRGCKLAYRLKCLVNAGGRGGLLISDK